MDSPTTKSQLLECIRQERATWEALLSEVGEAHMTSPGVSGDWTFKDVASHLNTWRLRAIDRLQAALQGEAPPPPAWAALLEQAGDDFDPINEWIRQKNHDRLLHDVLSESRETLQKLEELVQSLSEQDLFDPQRFPWMQGISLCETVMGNSSAHFFTDHEPEIRDWLRGLSV